MEISTNQTKYQLMMADENTRKVIRDFLEKVASGDVSGLDKSCGLCWALECEFRRKYMDDLVIGPLAYAFISNHSRGTQTSETWTLEGKPSLAPAWSSA